MSFNDLPLVEQPYPTLTPWRDISEFLMPGIGPVAEGRVPAMARVRGNEIAVKVYARIDQDAEGLPSLGFLDQLPDALVPVENVEGSGWHGSTPVRTIYTVVRRLQLHSGDGRVLADADTISVSLTAVRADNHP